MYDHLDPLFFRQAPAPRHSEPVDTHMAIRRHEHAPNPHRHGQDPSHEEHDSTLWSDSTHISVAMLRAFLQNLLATQTPQAPETGEGADEHANAGTAETANTQNNEPYEEQKSTRTNPARQAAHAYQSTARAVHDSNYDHWVANGPAIPDGAPILNEHEIEVVQTMIRDLEKLEARYIETLEINGNKNFLQAIRDAIDNAMGRD